VLTDRGTEYCGNPEHHEYELYLALEDIDHSRTKTKSPQTNGIVERFHKTVLDEFYRIAFRKKIYGSKAAAAFPRKSSPARTCGKASRPRRAGPRSRVARVSPHR
jgi:transposase InsO family protein